MSREVTLNDLFAALLRKQMMSSDSSSDDDDSPSQLPSRPTSAAPARHSTASGSQSSASQDSSYAVVVAMDFGTTYSGYACSFKGREGEIQMNKNWGSSGGYASYKTPTSVLVDPDGEFAAFGYDAQTRYASMTEEQAAKHYFFERFKMVLHHTKTLTRTTEITAANGKTFAALAVFAMAMRYLKEHFLDALARQMACAPDLDLIRWVLTVPAIWTDSSKQFMREAAYKAGIVKDVSSKQLLIALEPEAASLHCRGLRINQFVGGTGKFDLQHGTKYLVVDAGGGTLDVTAHQVVTEGKVKELYHATGGDHGGIKVDAEFLDLLEDVFTKKFMDVFRKECSGQWIQMLTDFEKKKREVKPETEGSTNLPLPWALGTKYMEVMKQGVEQAFKPCKRSGVKFQSGMICVSPQVMRQMFGSVLHRIVNHVRELLTKPELARAEYIFIVGGFGECPLLHDALVREFGSQLKILVPEEASLAVIKGAIKFGHNPTAVTARICPRTYGFKRCPVFEPGVHDSRRKVNIHGVDRCKDVFQTVVCRGDELAVNAYKNHEVKPVSAEQSSATINLFCSDQADVCYVDEEGVEQLGRVQVDWPGQGLNRRLDLQMIFGDTEIQVRATTYPLGLTARTNLDLIR